ncbi:MAG: DNA repair protein RecN [Deltaproteobacteria bacterium]|nr:DNA repair protein RecN [Deltaproteobacteria bacterium]
MLTTLSIRNIAVIEALNVEFAPKLNVITGETGAGKTILIYALQSLLGGRASTDMIRTGADAASITGCFTLDGDAQDVRRLLAEFEIEVGEGIVLHRILRADGKGKATINGIPATQQMLKRLGVLLIDLASQHEHQRLVDPTTHVEVIDTFGNLDAIVESYRTTFDHAEQCRRDLEDTKRAVTAAKEKTDFLLHQRRELVDAKLTVGEDERLDTERSRVKHAAQLEGRFREAYDVLYDGECAVTEQLKKALRALEQCQAYDASVTPWIETLVQQSSPIVDVAREIERSLEGLGADPARLEEIEERLHLVRELKRKHGGTIEACLEKLKSLSQELDLAEHSDDIVQKKEAALTSAREHLMTVGKDLARERRKTAKILCARVAAELADLGMKRVTLDVRFTEAPVEAWDRSGPEAAIFFISPNVGEALRPLAEIASGGELSRLLLVIKKVTGERGTFAATSVFDEVDTGIGGAIAESVGKKLQELARSRQVLCITHLPQVAACGDHHLCISKRIVKGRTVTELATLSTSARHEEIARMLAGKTVTPTARQHAKALLKVTLSLPNK